MNFLKEGDTCNDKNIFFSELTQHLEHYDNICNKFKYAFFLAAGKNDNQYNIHA